MCCCFFAAVKYHIVRNYDLRLFKDSLFLCPLSCQRHCVWTRTQSRFMVLSGCSVGLGLYKSLSVDTVQMNRTKTKLLPSTLTHKHRTTAWHSAGVQITFLKFPLMLKNKSEHNLNHSSCFIIIYTTRYFL